MNLNWEHIVWLTIGALCILWYILVFIILKKNKTKKNSNSLSNVQNSNIFVNNSSFEDLDMDHLLNQVDENVHRTELLDIFGKSEKDTESLIPKKNEKLKVIRNVDLPDKEEGEPPPD